MKVGVRSLRVQVADQTLHWLEDGLTYRISPCSTAARGVGERRGSEQTPRGRHVIRASIGAGCAAGTVFVGRRPTGEIWTAQLAAQYPERDWILTRILWLSGLQPGFNRLHDVDSMRRYIYIHATAPTEPMGVPRSHGCIRLHDGELLALFDWVRPGCEVEIVAP